MVTADGRRILRNPNCRATQLYPRYDLLKGLDEPLAVGIEFQEFKPEGAEKWDHRIGRIAFVNTYGTAIIDTYFRYPYDEKIKVKLPPKQFGVEWSDLRIENGARPIDDVRDDLNKIMAGRTIIGHGMRLDIRSLTPELKNEVNFVDTQHMYGQVKLEYLAAKYLKMDIQNGFHDPVEDAKATMGLYLLRHPYKNRTNFDPEPFEYKSDAFPTLATGVIVKKNKKGAGQGVASEIDQAPMISCNLDTSTQMDSGYASRDDSPAGVADGGGPKRSKGKKKEWKKFDF